MNMKLFGMAMAVMGLTSACTTSASDDDGVGGSSNGGSSNGGDSAGGTGNTGGGSGGTGNTGGGAGGAGACLGCGEWLSDETGADLCTDSGDIVDALYACYCEAANCGTECADADICGGATPASQDCLDCALGENTAGCTAEWNACANDLGG